MKDYIGMKAHSMGFDAHLTVLYTGDLDDTQEELVQDIVSGFGNPTFYVERRDIVMFGPNHDIPVLRVYPTYALKELREQLEKDTTIPSPSEFDWNPHISLKFESGNIMRIPPVILLTNLNLY